MRRLVRLLRGAHVVRLVALVAAAAAVGGAVTATTARLARMRHPATGELITVPGADGEQRVLHSGWRIQPAGRYVYGNDLPLGGAVSPDGRIAAVPNCGYNAHGLVLLDWETEKVVAQLNLPKAWAGTVFSPDGGRLYVSGGLSGARAAVHVVARSAEGDWSRDGTIALEGAPTNTCVSGMAISPDGRLLYALNLADNAVYVLDTEKRETRGKLTVGSLPIACALDSEGNRLYVACWGAAEVVVLRLGGNAPLEVTDRWKVGPHPNALLLSADGRLFVSCGNEDTVYELATEDGSLLERIRTSLDPLGPPGSTPNALALANSRLYVANADNNNVCVVDVRRRGRARVLGFIPTGWYPTMVLASPDGRKLLIGSGKGSGTRPNPARLPLHPDVPTGFEYIGRQLNGLLSFVDTPSDRDLARYTRQVVACTPMLPRKPRIPADTIIPRRPGDSCPIKYVLYIIKENRTYDQVFGDIPKGNGDPTLCLFGREVTPNQHALAEEFVLLDNLYCSGEVSRDGHPWSTMAYATDFTQRAWLLHYSGKGDLPGGGGMADSSAGFIWEACKARGIPFRTYGEYATHPSVEGFSCLEFIGKGSTGAAPPGRDTERAEIFLREFREFERTGTMPRFMVMSLGENHTNGTRPGSYTPKAMVASNDLALGRIVEAVSRSSLWREFAIFVIEDDAQNGPDHVDSHRTVGLVISPWVRRGSVDSTMYSTTSMLRTMELILGLPPLTQHDALATPMYACFTNKPDLRPYTALPARIDLNAKNPANAYGAAISAKMDWSEYDRIDEDALNRILWHSIKGRHVPYPGVVRSALVGGE